METDVPVVPWKTPRNMMRKRWKDFHAARNAPCQNGLRLGGAEGSSGPGSLVAGAGAVWGWSGIAAESCGSRRGNWVGGSLFEVPTGKGAGLVVFLAETLPFCALCTGGAGVAVAVRSVMIG